MEPVYANKKNLIILLRGLISSLDPSIRISKTKEYIDDLKLLLSEVPPAKLHEWLSEDTRLHFFKDLPMFKDHLAKEYDVRGKWVDMGESNGFDWRRRFDEDLE